MPYIDLLAREALLIRPPAHVGELNYVIHLELFREPIDEKAIAAIIERYLAGKEPSYTLYNSIAGVLHCVYWEFEDRKPERPLLYHVAVTLTNVERWFRDKYLRPYEIEKRKINGDVYPMESKE